MRDFVFHAPATLPEALSLLAEHRDDGRPIAGGTALVVLMKQSLVDADHLISLHRIPGLDSIRNEADGLHIGGLTKHRDVEQSPLVQGAAPLLADVYRHVATVRIRNVATVGGGLAHADPAMDAPAVWRVLGATMHLRSASGTRQVAADDFFEDFYTTALAPEEVLTAVTAPALPAGAGWSYQKFLPRSADDYAAVSVSALLCLDGDGRVARARVGIGSAAPIPVLAEAVGAALVGQQPTPQAIADAAELARDAVDPLDDLRGSAVYKRDMTVVFTRRALTEAAARARRA